MRIQHKKWRHASPTGKQVPVGFKMTPAVKPFGVPIRRWGVPGPPSCQISSGGHDESTIPEKRVQANLKTEKCHEQMICPNN